MESTLITFQCHVSLLTSLSQIRASNLPGLLPVLVLTCIGNHISLTFAVEAFETNTHELVPEKWKTVIGTYRRAYKMVSL